MFTIKVLPYLRKSIRPLFAIFLVATIIALSACARLGEASTDLSSQNVLPTQLVQPGVQKPGMGATGGPFFWSFWVKNRTAAADAMIGSFVPFTKLDTMQLAVSTNFVLYQQFYDPLVSNTLLTSAQANTVLATLETAYTNLKNVYGAGSAPYVNGGARIVILAYTIQDDCATTGNYVGGYFAPRDLYSNTFTSALYTDPVVMQQYSNLIGILGGYSNEMSIINYDLPLSSCTSTVPTSQINDRVIHELSHLFTYSKRVVSNRLANHDLWIAEGIAENAPNQTVQFANMEQLRLTQLASPSTITYYQSAPQITDFTTWGPKIIGYIQSNLFFNYLRHRAELNAAGSAATMIAQLITQNDGTISGIDSLISQYVPGSGFSALYTDYVLTHYLSMLGIPITDTGGINSAGGPGLQTTYNFANVNIGSSTSTVDGTIIKAKYESANSIPFNYDAPTCPDGSTGLMPNSYVIIRYQMGGDFTPPDTAGANTVPGELPLKFIVNLTSEANLISATPPASVSFLSGSAGTTFNVTAPAYGLNAQDVLHILIINPNTTGSCRVLNATNPQILNRNHSRWVGSGGTANPSPDYTWQKKTGAPWDNSNNGGYWRPGGVAVFTGGTPTTTPSYTPSNFLFVTDYNNMSVQKVDLDEGTPLGRLGSTSTTCPTSNTGWDLFTNRYQNNYCANSFDNPMGVYVDGSQNIYVADTKNLRIVKYDQNGNFQAWMGLNGTCSVNSWQGAASVTDYLTLQAAGATTGVTSSPCMFTFPQAVTSDGTNLYIVDNGAHRIIKRDMATGNFIAFIGNGSSGWITSSAAHDTPSGFGNGLFWGPSGVAIAGSTMYVADTQNMRIVRVDLTTGNFTGWMGNGVTGWQTSWGGSAPTGNPAVKYFSSPSGIATDGTYLYVADRDNNRVVKIVADGVTACGGPVIPARADSYCGWVGYGKFGWEPSQAAPGTDPYASVSYYPPEYYSKPQSIAIATAAQKGTRNDYLYITSVYNGRVTRININCADNPKSTACAASGYNPLAP